MKIPAPALKGYEENDPDQESLSLGRWDNAARARCDSSCSDGHARLLLAIEA